MQLPRPARRMCQRKTGTAVRRCCSPCRACSSRDRIRDVTGPTHRLVPRRHAGGVETLTVRIDLVTELRVTLETVALLMAARATGEPLTRGLAVLQKPERLAAVRHARLRAAGGHTVREVARATERLRA